MIIGLNLIKFKGAQVEMLGLPFMSVPSTAAFYRKAFTQKLSKPINYLSYDIYDYLGTKSY